MPSSETNERTIALTSSPGGKSTRVAYMMSRFPKITETFILREMIEIEKSGIAVELFPLRRERTSRMQPEARPYVERAHFAPFLSGAMVWANLIFLCGQPLRYLTTLATLIRANWGSPRYLVGALAHFPKAVLFARQMRRMRIDHLHAHFASHPAAIAYAIGQLAGIPYSFTAHGSDLHRDQHMLREKTVAAAFVVAISEYNRNMILDVCGHSCAHKVHVIHCGIDPARFPARTQRSRLDRGEGCFSIVCVGTLHEVKGQTHLIEACRQLHERQIPFECHFMGGGPDELRLRAQVQQAGLVKEVQFHGVCTSDEVQRQLADADVLVAPSVPSRDGRREGIPVVLMEAMAVGLPCVSSRLSGIPEIVADGQTGFLTEPGDAVAIADALERLAKDGRLRHQLGQAGTAKVLREFHLSQNCQTLAGHFADSANRAGVKA